MYFCEEVGVEVVVPAVSAHAVGYAEGFVVECCFCVDLVAYAVELP